MKGSRRLPRKEDLTKKPEPAPAIVMHGTIDPAYSSGSPQVTFDGEAVLSVKTYKCLSSYTPVASDRVLILRDGDSAIILGKMA